MTKNPNQGSKSCASSCRTRHALLGQAFAKVLSDEVLQRLQDSVWVKDVALASLFPSPGQASMAIYLLLHGLHHLTQSAFQPDHRNLAAEQVSDLRRMFWLAKAARDEGGGEAGLGRLIVDIKAILTQGDLANASFTLAASALQLSLKAIMYDPRESVVQFLCRMGNESMWKQGQATGVDEDTLARRSFAEAAILMLKDAAAKGVQVMRPMEKHAWSGLEMAGGSSVAQWRLPGYAVVAWSPDGKVIAVACQDQKVHLLDAVTGAEVGLLVGHEDRMSAIAFSPDSTMLMSGSMDTTARVWSLPAGEELAVLRGHSDRVNALAWSPKDAVVATSSDKLIKLWSVKEPHMSVLELASLTGHQGWVNAVAFSSLGRMLASASHDKTAIIWDVDRRVVLLTLTGHSDSVQGVCFTPDESLVVTGSSDKSVRVWDTLTGKEKLVLMGHSNYVGDVAVSPGNVDSPLIASASEDQTVRLWSLADGKLVRVLKGHSRTVLNVCFSPNGALLASGSTDRTVRVWSTSPSTKDIIVPPGGHTKDIVSLALSDKWLCSHGRDKLIRVCRAVDGAFVCDLKGHTDEVTSLALSADDALLLSGSMDKTARLWSLHGGRDKLLRVLEGHSNWVKAVAISPDGTLGVTGGKDRKVIIWRLDNGQQLRVMEGHQDWVTKVHFSLDGARVMSVDWKGETRIWSLADQGQSAELVATYSADQMPPSEVSTFVIPVAKFDSQSLVAPLSGDTAVACTIDSSTPLGVVFQRNKFAWRSDDKKNVFVWSM